MAMETVNDWQVTQFSDMIHVLAQQMRSRLRPLCEVKKMTGDDWAYDRLGRVEAREIVTRFTETQFDDIEHSRRRITRRRFVVTIGMDEYDTAGMLTDPQGKYASAVMAAMERQFDLMVYDAMFADVETGRTFGTTVTFAGEGGLTVNATAGLTLAKLLEIKQNFIDNEVGNDIPRRLAVGISGDEHTTLLQIAQLTSGDYSRQFALEKGEIVRAVGMDLIHFGASVTRPVLAVAGGVRTSFAMAEGAICVGISKEMEITVKDRADLVQTKQLQIVASWGAVRTETALIQKLTTTD